jgi:hypothetical protein
MTGTMHVADHQGDTTHTWDTADPAAVQEIESSSRRPRRPGGWSTARPPTARASRCASTPGTLRSTPSCSSPPGWPAASAWPQP